MRVLLMSLVAVLAPVLVAQAQTKPAGQQRWVYLQTNLLVNENTEAAEALIRRAASAGYTHLCITDSKFGRLADMPASYFEHVNRVKAAADAAKMQVVPCLFPIGWSESLLSRDPNLIEALPVRDAVFVVAEDVAGPEPEPAAELPGGDFADLRRWTWKDETVVADNGAALVKDPAGKNARIVQKITVRPHRQYHISVRVKTADFVGTPEVKVLAPQPGGKDWRALIFTSLGARRTQDWTEHHVVFNSFEHETVSVYFGAWDGRTGSLWWDDAKVEPAGLLNVVRREGTPLTVKTDDGRVLTEGSDFERVTDPRMGTVPWRGAFEVWHEPPVIKLKNAALPRGAKLLVSFCHGISTDAGKTMICPSEPGTLEVLRDQAKRMHEAWGAKGYFMEHDEIRVLGWDDACASRGLDSGAILADNVAACLKILREINPGGAIYVWSDMFDPHHNAHAGYYLVRGDLAGSWNGLDKDVIIVNWNFGERDKSLKWFADRGHRQIIAGYYDGPVERVKSWLDAARRVGGVDGVMYTTWGSDHSRLEAFAEQLADD